MYKYALNVSSLTNFYIHSYLYAYTYTYICTSVFVCIYLWFHACLCSVFALAVFIFSQQIFVTLSRSLRYYYTFFCFTNFILFIFPFFSFTIVLLLCTFCFCIVVPPMCTIYLLKMLLNIIQIFYISVVVCVDFICQWNEWICTCAMMLAKANVSVGGEEGKQVSGRHWSVWEWACEFFFLWGKAIH